MLTPMFGGDDDQNQSSNDDQFSSRSTDNVVSVDPSRIDPLSPDHYQRSSHDPSSQQNDGGRNISTGHSLRRGIFNLQPPNQKTQHQGSKPATINIQIPGKLPFNPFNLFNMDTLKSLVQSVTENFTGNKKAYPTGFEDSVTIISEDPEKPVPRAINSPSSDVLNLNNQNTNGIVSNNHAQQPDPLPFVRLPVDLQTQPKKPIRQQQNQNQQQNSIFSGFSSSNSKSTNSNHLNKFHNNNHSGKNSLQSQIPSPPLQNPALLTEESMINKQMETLNEVLTHEMNSKDHRISTTIAPLTFPFLPDLSALSQLFNWGEQGARTLAVCNACRVGFGLFVSRVSEWTF